MQKGQNKKFTKKIFPPTENRAINSICIYKREQYKILFKKNQKKKRRRNRKNPQKKQIITTARKKKSRAYKLNINIFKKKKRLELYKDQPRNRKRWRNQIKKPSITTIPILYDCELLHNVKILVLFSKLENFFKVLLL